MKKRFLFVVPILLGMFLSACGSEESSSAAPSVSSSVVASESDDKRTFENVFFDDATYTYDGTPHILGEVRGAPEGTSITYSNRTEHTDVGNYPASARLEKDGYRTLSLDATLIINPATFSGLEYNSVVVMYDGTDHINDIQLVGVLPEGTSTTETVKNQSGAVVTSAIDAGTYEYECVVTNSNYNSATYRAQLVIRAQRQDMPVFAANDGTIYFANGLHNRYLYSLNSSSELSLIDYSAPKEFSKSSGSSASFIAGSVFLNSVKEISGGTTSVLYTDGNIDDFVKVSDTVYYYASNSLKAAKSGIYKVDATDTDNEPIVTKVFEGKSDHLSIYGNYLYFTNGNDHDYLYKMSLSTHVTSLVMETKVHEYVIDGNKLYCTVNKVDDYIGVLDLTSSSTEPTRILSAAGELLTVKNGYLYFVFTDMIAYLQPEFKGIWRMDPSKKDQADHLVEGEVNGFDVESSNSLVYIDADDLHLYRYNIQTEAKTDLLAGFVAPESTPLNTGGQTASVGTKTYYLNMHAGKTLWLYDETTEKNYQLTANKVQDFCIYDGVMYFNQVTMLTNNDIYTVNLNLGGEAEKISSNDLRNMMCDGTYLYGTHYNWAGAAGGIARMKLDGSEYVKFSEVNGAKNFAIRDGKLYYINCATGNDDGDLEYIDLSVITSTSEDVAGTTLSSKIKNVKQFLFDGDNIFFIYESLTENSIRKVSFSSLGDHIKIVSEGSHPRDMVLSGGYIYYYSYRQIVTSKAGFYKVSKNATADETQELVLGYDSTYYGTALSLSNSGNLYFLNYIPSLTMGDAHFYQLNLNTKAVARVD